MTETIQPVSPAEFGTKISNMLVTLTQTVSSFIVPLATLAMLISVIVFITGSVVHSKIVRKTGAVGFFSAAGGLLLFYGIPLIMGVLANMSRALK